MRILIIFDSYTPNQANREYSARELFGNSARTSEYDVMLCLQRLGHEVESFAVYDDIQHLLRKLESFRPDLVFNAVESFAGNRSDEPGVPALLNMLKIPYTGSSFDGLYLCNQKPIAKKLMTYHGIKTPEFTVVGMPHRSRHLQKFSYPAFVKSSTEEASVGISLKSLAWNRQAALARARYINWYYDCDALIEQYIEGRELYVGLIASEPVTILPPMEIFFRKMPPHMPKFATFSAKWNLSYRKRWGISSGPAKPLPAKTENELRRIATCLCHILKIRGAARLDLRLTADGELYVLEVNPNPPLSRSDTFARAASAAGICYERLINSVALLGFYMAQRSAQRKCCGWLRCPDANNKRVPKLARLCTCITKQPN